MAEWSELGVSRTDGRPLPRADLPAALVLPAGREGPAFLVYGNYRVILKWNRSVFYAIAVGLLADQIVGRGPKLLASANDQALQREEIKRMQEGLRELGYLLGAADGVVGSMTRRALRAFQRARGEVPDGYPDAEMVEAVARRVAPGP